MNRTNKIRIKYISNNLLLTFILKILEHIGYNKTKQNYIFIYFAIMDL